MWKITSPENELTSYFYGIFHIQDKRVFNFMETLIEKIDECDVLALEISFDDSTNKIAE
ncbi:MAG: TraB/GumN family protein [Ignavibacteriales bacterium]|nr:TraB/GumN family protein [Ignavibacteriales bacterium]